MKFLLAISFSLFILSACRFFEGQVKINEMSTVKYQGTGISQKDAERLGNFLLKQGYFNTFDQRIVYLRKRKNRFEVTFIIERELFMSDKDNLLPGFQIWHQWINDEVFPNSLTRLRLDDKHRKVLHTIDTTASTYR